MSAKLTHVLRPDCCLGSRLRLLRSGRTYCGRKANVDCISIPDRGTVRATLSRASRRGAVLCERCWRSPRLNARALRDEFQAEERAQRKAYKDARASGLSELEARGAVRALEKLGAFFDAAE
jgi:hypothetical protein